MEFIVPSSVVMLDLAGSEQVFNAVLKRPVNCSVS